jgi:uncharacterized RDD family membrane protein YckC
MNVRAERAIPSAAAREAAGKREEIVLNFDAARLKAPFALRCGALLIDYIVFVSIPIISLLFRRWWMEESGSKLIASDLNNISWLVAILLGLANFILFPMISGQSIGKMLTGLQIIRTDGSSAGIGNLLLRHLVGYPLTVLTLFLGFMLAAVNKSGRALHDFAAGTIVVYGKRKMK